MPARFFVDENDLALGRHWAAIETIVHDEPDGPWMRSVTERELRLIPLILTRASHRDG